MPGLRYATVVLHMPTKKEKIVITGGAGFVGSHLSKKLIEEGYEVFIIDNLSAGKKSNIPKEAHFYKMDICHYEKIKPLFKGATYVFHLAAIPSVEFSIHNPLVSHNTNVNGTLNVFDIALKAGVSKVIFASSSSLYGNQKTKKLDEKMIPNPQSPYALQKNIGENYAKLYASLYGLNTLSLRFFNIYGPGQNHEGAYAFVIAKFLKLKAENKDLEITGDGLQSRDFVYIDDVVAACIQAMKTKTTPGDFINIGGGKGLTINTIAQMIGGTIKHITARIEPKDTESNNTKALKVLNWKPHVSLKDGLKRLQS